MKILLTVFLTFLSLQGQACPEGKIGDGAVGIFENKIVYGNEIYADSTDFSDKVLKLPKNGLRFFFHPCASKSEYEKVIDHAVNVGVESWQLNGMPCLCET